MEQPATIPTAVRKNSLATLPVSCHLSCLDRPVAIACSTLMNRSTSISPFLAGEGGGASIIGTTNVLPYDVVPFQLLFVFILSKKKYATTPESSLPNTISNEKHQPYSAPRFFYLPQHAHAHPGRVVYPVFMLSEAESGGILFIGSTQ